MSRKKIQTLSDKISNVLNTAPGLIDPEDDIYEDTRAKVVSNDDTEDEDIGNFKPSKIKKQNLELLENLDTRYAGKRKSRKDFEDSDENVSGEQSDDNEEVSDDNNSNVDDEDDSGEDANEEDDSGEDANEEDSNVDDEDDSDDDEDFGEDNDESREENETNFKHMREENINSHVQKGKCVKNQLRLWENLLEVRIKLQKCLITANRLPQTETYSKIKEKSGDEFKNLAIEAQSNVSKVLDSLLNLQDTLLKKYPETKNIDQKTEKVEESDEEIPSDEDENINSKNEEETNEPAAKKPKTLPEYEQTISKRHNNYKDYRNNVIRKWNEKTRLSVSKNLITNSVINQIDYILKDREKYIRKTQLKRSNYNIVGLKCVKSGSDDENDNTSKKRSYEEYNAEIYDDDDFYHQLLRELIEYKSTNITDPIKLSQQWIQLQSMRSKMKRNVDTKATKGRKIRYTVHTKLVNFLAPMGGNEWTDHAKKELYNSLFGKNLPK